jgi:phosphomevalonate kinase
VQHGGRALVAAMPQRAHARYVPHAASGATRDAWRIEAPTLQLVGTLVREGASLTPDAAGMPAPLRLMAAAIHAHWAGGQLPPGTLICDTSEFYRGPIKLGLGSSAAVLVAAWSALGAAACLPERDAPCTLAELRALHSAAQGGQGSGVDLAASLVGGTLTYRLEGASIDAPDGVDASTWRPEPTPLPWRDDVHILPIWTGEAAATGPFLAAYAALRARDPGRHRALHAQLAALGDEGCALWADGPGAALLPLADRAMATFRDLGAALQLPVLGARHEQAAAIVSKFGGAYKPSGAGGGDFGLAFVEPSEDLLPMAAALSQINLSMGKSLKKVMQSHRSH